MARILSLPNTWMTCSPEIGDFGPVLIQQKSSHPSPFVETVAQVPDAARLIYQTTHFLIKGRMLRILCLNAAKI